MQRKFDLSGNNGDDEMNCFEPQLLYFYNGTKKHRLGGMACMLVRNLG